MNRTVRLLTFLFVMAGTALAQSQGVVSRMPEHPLIPRVAAKLCVTFTMVLEIFSGCG